jgi:uncharacterized protein
MCLSTALVGSIVALWRYPVKSMQGEELSGAPITERGILGDRAYTILDKATGHIASAKHPRKWGNLLACRATFVEPPRLGAPLPPVWIGLSDGTVIQSAQSDVDQILSHVLGRDVTLITAAPTAPTREANRTPIDSSEAEEIIRQEEIAIAAPAGTFFDYAPLHLLTTATIDRLRAAYPAGDFEPRRFRPNIVVAPSEDARGFVENAWLGQTLEIGPGIQLRMIDPCPRCVVTTLAQANMPRDPGILRTIGQLNAVTSVTLAPGVIMPAVVGVYASVHCGGMLRHGDAVRLA